MDRETIVLIVLIALAVMGVWLIVASERARLKKLELIYRDICPGDKYRRPYRSVYGPDEVEFDVVVVVHKWKTSGGVRMLSYEYEDGNGPHDVLLEDFIDRFDRME